METDKSSEETNTSEENNTKNKTGQSNITIKFLNTFKVILEVEKDTQNVIESLETIVLDSAPSSPKRNRSPEIIDLDEYTNKKVKLDTPCINYDCQSGLDLQIASGWCLTYYRVKEEKKKQEICRVCFEEAFKFNQVSSF